MKIKTQEKIENFIIFDQITWYTIYKAIQITQNAKNYE